MNDCELPTPVDWKRVIICLRYQNGSDLKTASLLDVSPSTLRNWKNDGREPPYRLGAKLVNLAIETLTEKQRSWAGI